VVSETDVCAGLDQGLILYSLPKSLKLLKSVDVSSGCRSVCEYEGNTYIGLLAGGIYRIDESFNVSQSFIGSNRCVESVTVFKDRICVLFRVDYVSTVSVYTLSGDLLTSWYHEGESINYNKHVIIDDQVVISNRLRQSFTIYSLTGKVIKHVPCSLLSPDSPVAICTADRHCIVVSDYGSSQVFKLDLTTEKVIWTCKDVSLPESLTCYRSKYILVASCNNKTIWVLDVKTGQ